MTEPARPRSGIALKGRRDQAVIGSKVTPANAAPKGLRHSLGRADFYEQAQSGETSLVIATGDQRRFADLLLTIGGVLREG